MRLGRVAGVLAVVGALGASIVSSVGAQTAPDAVDDTATVAEDQSVIINVLANDTPAGITIASVGEPSKGSVIIATGVLVYTPKTNFHGTATLEYTITDGTATDNATVTITVLPVNDAPTAKSDSAKTTVGTAAEIDVLKNDKDIDGDTLSVVLITPPANGVATVNTTTQKVTYTPTAGFSGSDSFTYRAADGSLTSETVTVNVKVKDESSVHDGRSTEVIAACESYTGPVAGVHTLCSLYLGNDLPIWARASLGKTILRHANPSDDVVEVCAQTGNSAQVQRLCAAYESGWLPGGLHKKVAKMIIASVSADTDVTISINNDEKKSGKKSHEDHPHQFASIDDDEKKSDRKSHEDCRDRFASIDHGEKKSDKKSGDDHQVASIDNDNDKKESGRKSHDGRHNFWKHWKR